MTGANPACLLGLHAGGPPSGARPSNLERDPAWATFCKCRAERRQRAALGLAQGHEGLAADSCRLRPTGTLLGVHWDPSGTLVGP